MWSIFENELQMIDIKMENEIAHDIPSLFEKIPLELFGELSLGVPNKFPNLKKWFPTMPIDKVQDDWTGTHGELLLKQTIEFVKTLNSGYATISGKKLTKSKILDYGCGWGRITRLLNKYVLEENIYAVDPWDESIQICIDNKLKGRFEISDYVPIALPFMQKFDLIYAFSVFTHLSEKTATVVLKTLKDYIKPDGVLAITIRPKEYWEGHAKNNELGDKFASKMIKLHDQYGFAFSPHNRLPINGDITYGDTSMTLEYINSHFPDWKISLIEFNDNDPYQIVVFLTSA